MRAFIAIELLPTTQDEIHTQIQPLKQKMGNSLVRWVPPQNLHLTLKFLGEVPASNLEFLQQILTRESQAQPPFEMQFGSLGCFPNPRLPRVIWIGLQAPATLALMQQNIETEVDKLGYGRRDRSFSPHLTLGRVRQAVSDADMQKIRSALEVMQLGRIQPTRVDSIHLFKSDLHPSGSVYTKIYSARMKQPANHP